MTWFSNRYNSILAGLLLSVVAVFLYIRPLDGSSHHFIAGDGLGYYAYLPATFIYDDTDYEFKWFNAVHQKHYSYSLFENPEDNFMVQYGDRRVNKYYQGLSFLWLPFFAVAHLIAKLSGAPADGFSLPYQNAIGLASLCYLLLGLLFLHRLLRKMFRHQVAALMVPFALIYGTHLFSFGFTVNSHTHLYSFTFIVLFIYYLHAFFNESSGRFLHLLLCLLALCLTVFIRPLNGLIVLLVPAFYRSLPRQLFRPVWNWRVLVVSLLLLALMIFQLGIIYRQTGSLFAYTYTSERFYFNRSRFFDALISYHMGLFVYIPFFFLSLFGIPFLARRQRIILPLFFLLMVYIYASWWYWPIVKRGMIDFYVIPAIFAGALIARFHRVWQQVLGGVLVLLCVGYYQMKYYQIHAGVLDEWITTKELFWRNFFRTGKSWHYPVPASSIRQRGGCLEAFNAEHKKGPAEKDGSRFKYLVLDGHSYIAKVITCKYPAFMADDGLKKARLSFSCYFGEGLKAVHLFMQFRDREGKLVKEAPFYINPEEIVTGKWDYREYGCEIGDNDFPSGLPQQVEIIAWNVHASGSFCVDDLQLEFFLTDESFETYLTD